MVYYSENQTMNCKECGKEFIPKGRRITFCSQECYIKDWIKKNRERYRKYQNEYSHNHPRPSRKDYLKSYYHKTRERIKEALGNRCVICGVSGKEAFLIIDHIHRHMKKEDWLNKRHHFQGATLRQLKEGELQLLCKSCNSAKSHIRKYQHLGLLEKLLEACP